MTRPRWLLVLTCGALTSACKPEPTVPPEQPPPDVSPAEVEAPPAETGPTFVFVTYGASSPRARFFNEFVDSGGPAIVHTLAGDDDWPAAMDAIVDRNLGDEGERNARYEEDGIDTMEVDLDADELAKAGVDPPGDHVWLIGPEGPCRATIGQPSLGWYSWGLESIELRWRVDASACAIGDGEGWSQIGLTSAEVPDDLRFRYAVVAGEEQLDPEEAKSRFTGEFQRFVAYVADAIEADEYWVQRVVVPETRLVELTFAAVDRVTGKRADPCDEHQVNGVSVGFWEGRDYNRLDLTGDGTIDRDSTQLTGAFVVGEEVLWSVHEYWGQALVHDRAATPPATIELHVGNFHPEDFGEHFYSKVEYCGP